MSDNNEDLGYVRALVARKVRRMIVGKDDVERTTAHVFARLLALLFWSPAVDCPSVDLDDAQARALDEWLRDTLAIRALMAADAAPQPSLFRRRLRAVLTRAQVLFEI